MNRFQTAIARIALALMLLPAAATAWADTFLDTFSSTSYSNQNGDHNWSSNWNESGDDFLGSPYFGDIDIAYGMLHLQNDNKSIARSADLSTYTSATLSFDYQAYGFGNSYANVSVQVRAGGSGAWHNLETFAAAGTGSASYDIGNYIDAVTEIRFVTSSDYRMGYNDDFYVDNVLITATASAVPGNSCAATFPDAVSSNSASGSIQFGYGSRVIGSPDNILDTTSLLDTSGGVSCNTSACSKSGNAVTAMSYNNFPGGPSVYLGYLGSQVLAPGDYGSIFTGYLSTLTFSPGDYTVSGSLNIGSAANLVVSGSGTVRIFVNGTVSFNSQANINNPGSASQLLIFSNSNIVLTSPTTVNGILYSNGSVITNNGSVVTGAVTGASVILGSASTVNYDSAAVGSADFGSLCSSSPTPPTLPTPIAQWHMDETKWTGAGGSVQDSSGSGYDAKAEHGAKTSITAPDPAIVGDPGTCRYGDFDGSNDFVTVPSSFPDLTGSFTVTAWIYANDNNGDKRIFIDDQSNNGGFGFSLGDGGAGKLRFFSRSVNPISVDTRNALIPTGGWHFVAAVHDVNSKTRRIYVDGNFATLNNGNTSATYSGTWRSDTGPATIGGETDAAAESVAKYHFNGEIDEVQVFDSALNQSELDAVYAQTHACAASVLDHYSISVSSVDALTCAPITVTITGHDAADNEVAPGSGTSISLSTTTGNGFWSNPSAGTLVDNGGGNASYTYATNDKSITLSFNHDTAGTVNIRVNGSSSVTPGEDPAITFRDSGFRFVDNTGADIGEQIAGRPSGDYYLQAVRKDDVTKACVAAFPNGTTHNVDLAVECQNPATCAGTPFQLGFNTSSSITRSVDLSPVNLGALIYSPQSLYFDAAPGIGDGAARIDFKYADAGKIKLYAQSEITGTGGDASGKFISGSSIFVVKPAGLCVEALDMDGTGPGSPVCSPLASNCTRYVRAVDDKFTLHVSGKVWVVDGEKNSEFCDNNTTPNFQLDNITLTGQTVLPVGGNGSLSPSTVNIISGGSVDLPEAVVNNIGVYQFTAVPPAYLGTSIDASISANVGRFIHDHYIIASSSIDPADSTGATAYTYLGQAFDVHYQLQAVASSGAVFSNFSESYNNINIDTDVVYGAVDKPAAPVTPLGNSTAADRLAVGASTINSAPSGQLEVSVPVTIARAASPDGPFSSVVVGLELTDADGLTLLPSALDLDADNNGSKELFQLSGSPGELRFGRLLIPPVYGPEIPTTAPGNTESVPFEEQYFNGTTFVRNSDDGQSAYLGHSCSPGTLSCSAVTIQSFPSVSVTAGLSTASAPTNEPTITRPGTPGTINLGLSVESWLQFDWTGTGSYNQDPKTTITFGSYRGNDRIIYWRER